MTPRRLQAGYTAPVHPKFAGAPAALVRPRPTAFRRRPKPSWPRVQQLTGRATDGSSSQPCSSCCPVAAAFRSFPGHGWILRHGRRQPCGPNRVLSPAQVRQSSRRLLLRATAGAREQDLFGAHLQVGPWPTAAIHMDNPCYCSCKLTRIRSSAVPAHGAVRSAGGVGVAGISAPRRAAGWGRLAAAMPATLHCVSTVSPAADARCGGWAGRAGAPSAPGRLPSGRGGAGHEGRAGPASPNTPEHRTRARFPWPRTTQGQPVPRLNAAQVASR